jgi:diadenylate cyclase
VPFLERISDVLQRVRGYPLHEVLIELALVWVVVYLVVRFLRRTRGARVIKAMALILIVATPILRLLSSNNQFERLNYLYGPFVTFAALTLVIVFQPELRRALVRLGEAPLLRVGGLGESRVIEEIVASVAYLSRNKVGALIAIEGHAGLEGVVEGGTPLDAKISRELLNTIFWRGSALHDMAVHLREDRVIAAGVQLPLAEGEQFGSELGSRHRAAIGLTQECDALVIVVSEETGIVSLASRGQLTRNLTPETLWTLLAAALGEARMPEEITRAA